MKRVFIDTDGEFDDVMALILSFKLRDLSFEGITTGARISMSSMKAEKINNRIKMSDNSTRFDYCFYQVA